MPNSQKYVRHSLEPITALGGSKPRLDTIGNVTCSEVPDVALASCVAKLGQETKAKTALKKALGTTVPDVGCVTTHTFTAFWIGPEQWMVEAPFDLHEDLAAHLIPFIKGHGYVAEQTDAWTRFDVQGAQVLSVMELLCNLDTRRMDADTVSRSTIHHLGCYVRRLGAEHFAIYGPRASAGSLHHAIITAMHSAA